MKRFFKKLDFRTVGLVLWCLLATVFIYHNWMKFWTDSEVWAITATKYFFAGYREYFFGIKPLFHFLLWLNFQLSAFLEVYPVDLARLEVGFAAVLVMVFCDLYLQRKKVSASGRFLFQMTLFSCSMWLYRAGEVRSDIISCLVMIFSLWLLTVVSRPRWKNVVFFTAGMVSALVTPKSLLVFLAVSPLFLTELPFDFFKKIKKPSWNFVGGFALFFLFSFQMLANSFHFFLNEFSAKTSGTPFFSLLRMEHIFKLFSRNPQLILLLAVMLALASFKKRDLFVKPYFWVPWLVLVFIFCYPDPLPFLLASLLPWLLLGIFQSLDFWIGQWRGVREKLFLTVGTLIAVGCFSWWSHRIYSHTSASQRAFANWAERELLFSDILIYDPTGILTLSNAQHWFLGPAMDQHYSLVMDSLLKAKPEVILYTYKALFLEPNLTPWLRKEYYRWAPFMYIRSLDSQELTGKSCAEIIKKVGLFFSESRTRWVYLWEPEGYGNEIEALPLEAGGEACRKLRSSDKRYLVFPIKPPPPPAENLIELFRYDPEF